jgi:O-antigen/teichoic acid export membrane protein
MISLLPRPTCSDSAEQAIPSRNSGLAAWLPANTDLGFAKLWSHVLRLGQTRLARSVAWSIIGSAFAQGGNFLSSVVLARVLGKEPFGQFSFIESTVTAFTTFASLGLGLTATKYITEYRASQPEKIGKLLGLSSMLVVVAGACFSIALAVCAPVLAVRSAHSSIIPAFRLGTIWVFFLTLTGYQLGVLAGFEAFKSIGRVGILCGLASPLLSWWGAVKFGMLGAVAAQCVGSALLWYLYKSAVTTECRRRGLAVQYRGAWEQRSVLTRVSIPAAACGIIISLVVWGSDAILAKASGYGELAVFAAVGNLRSAVIFLPALTFRVAAPRLNYMFAANDAGFNSSFWGAVGINGGLALLGALVAFFEGHRLIALFGKQFDGSNWLLALVLGSVVLEVTATNLYMALVVRGRFWWNLQILSFWGVLMLAVSAIACPRYGATGLGMANLAAWSLAAALYAAAARKQNHRGAIS